MKAKSKSASDAKMKANKGAEKPISLAPLSEVEALRGLLQVRPVKSEAIKKASKKRVAKKKAGK